MPLQGSRVPESSPAWPHHRSTRSAWFLTQRCQVGPDSWRLPNSGCAQRFQKQSKHSISTILSPTIKKALWWQHVGGWESSAHLRHSRFHAVTNNVFWTCWSTTNNVPIPSALRHRRSTLLQQAFGHRSLNLIAVQRTYRYSGFRIWYLMHLQWNLLGKLP